MAKKTTKKPSARRSATSKTTTDGRAKGVSEAKAKSQPKSATKAKSVRVSKSKVAKAATGQARKKRSAKKLLEPLFTGAGAKLAGKVGSVLPARKVAATKRRRSRAAPLTAEELDEFRELLLRNRAELLGNVARMRAETLEQNRQDAAGNLSKFPTNPADLGTDNYELEFTLSLLEGERELLREIDEALGRIDQGTYGICEGTGEPIPRDRLDYEPWARYTVEYTRLKERGLTGEDTAEDEDTAEADEQ